MAQFIVNPRRSPRAPARCRAAVVSSAGWFEAETEDIGSTGCQIVSPKVVRKGDLLQLVVTNDKLSEMLKVNGRVAWVSPQPPWRVGIAFDDLSRKETARWFDRLVAAYPGMSGYQRVPDRIRADATVYLAAPPRFLFDFTDDEAVLLRAIGSGARVDELIARARGREAGAQRALFSLIARQAITFQRGQAGHPDSWKRILAEIEASLEVESLAAGPGATAVPGRPTPAPAGQPPAGRSAAAPVRPAARDPRVPDHGGDDVPLELAGTAHRPPPSASARGAARGIDAAGWTPDEGRPAHKPDFERSGVGWRKPQPRGAEAAAAFDRGVAEIQMGNVNGAITLLRYALSLAPGDPEIAEVLGKLAFKDR